MMTSPRALNAVINKVVRQLGGLGKLPDRRRRADGAAASRATSTSTWWSSAAGRRGSAARREAARGRQEDAARRRAGSRRRLATWRIRSTACARPTRRSPRALKAGVEVLSSSTALAWYPEDAPTPAARRACSPCTRPTGLLDGHRRALRLRDRRLRSERAVRRQRSARACCRRARSGACWCASACVPAERPVVVGDGPYARALDRGAGRAGAEVTRIDGTTSRSSPPTATRWVRSVRDEPSARSIKCDLVAVAALPAPASELPRQHGVPVALRRRARRLSLPRRRRRPRRRCRTCSPAATSPASAASTTRSRPARAADAPSSPASAATAGGAC